MKMVKMYPVFNEFEQDLKWPKTKKFKYDNGTADTKCDGLTNFKATTYVIIYTNAKKFFIFFINIEH